MSTNTLNASRLAARLKTLEMLDALLPTLSSVLDIREVFDRVSEIAQQVLPHDGVVIGELFDNNQRVRMYATQGLDEGGSAVEVPLLDPKLVTESWEWRLVDDLLEQPQYSNSTIAKFGMRGALFVPVRVDGKMFGGVAFYSKQPSRFSTDDVLPARRIADHVALALSHKRLADETRSHQALRDRSAKSDLLDDLLATVTDTSELPVVFERISKASQNVLAHDALVLTAVLPGGTSARVYASQAPGAAALPEFVPVPSYMQQNPDWEYDLVEDIQKVDDQRNSVSARLGFRSALRVPIRIDGEFVAGLAFLSRTADVYSTGDVPFARRIADRLTLSFSRERGKALVLKADEAAARAEQLEARVRSLTDELNRRAGFHRVIGDSAPWKQVLTQATQVGATETTVLLLGESGTGKEVMARFIHRASPRGRGPFVALNCAALPEQLLEAELFGYERGAFTGAMQTKPGQLEQAAGGTLFLDEVGEMSPSAQAKFLRVLQEKEFQRLGGTRVIKSDARIIAATNRNLEELIGRNEFREDLYYRLNVFAIRLPPLRERRDDVLVLSEAFLAELSGTLGRPPAGLSREARRALTEYRWPGNVRELRNILERAAILADGGLIVPEHLAFRSLPAGPAAAPAPKPAVADAPSARPPQDETGDLKSVEKSMIARALQDARFNKSQAAKALGLTRSQLYARLRRHRLE